MGWTVLKCDELQILGDEWRCLSSTDLVGLQKIRQISVMKQDMKDYMRSLGITLVLDTVITLVLYLMVLKDQSFWSVFAISQITGLSICSCVQGAVALGEAWFPSRSAVTIALGLAAGIAVSSSLSWVFLMAVEGGSGLHYYRQVLLPVAVFGVVFGVPIIYYFLSRAQLAESEQKIKDEKIKRLTLEKESAMTTMRLLQAQIEPHFLFNTLSNVIVLLDNEPEKARTMLTDLNTYLRISLDRTRQQMVTLSQELDLVAHYLAIFKTRMGDRLRYAIHDRTGNPEIPFPPLIVQPLVENALKYGIEPKVEGGSIEIDCRVDSGRLIIEISDTGCGLGENQGDAGIGINNVSRRLAGLYGSGAGLELIENSSGGLTALIRVPL